MTARAEKRRGCNADPLILDRNVLNCKAVAGDVLPKMLHLDLDGRWGTRRGRMRRSCHRRFVEDRGGGGCDVNAV